MKGKAIAYYRVSTAPQGQSGLGLEAQKAAVKAFCKARGLVIVESFQDVESGKHDDRPGLEKALTRAKASRATLVIAKLDRLSRDGEFLYHLRNTGVSFEALDIPGANTLTLGVMIALAQQERELISSRTKAALAELKAKGKKLGSAGRENMVKSKGWLAGGAAMKRAARKRANGALHTAAKYREKKMTLQEIADALNKGDYRTAHNKLYTPTTVARLLKMAAENQAG